MGWIIAGLIVAAIITGICIYAYYYNNVWHPQRFGLPDLNEEREKSHAKMVQKYTVTWVNAEGQTRSLCKTVLFGVHSRVAFEERHCLICDMQGDGIIVEAITLDGFDRPRQHCPVCMRTFSRAVDVETGGGERVFPGYDIDDINQPYDTWRSYVYILRQIDDGTLSDEEGHEQIDALLNKRSRSAEATRRAIAQAATAQAIALRSAAAEIQMQRLAERARHL